MKQVVIFLAIILSSTAYSQTKQDSVVRNLLSQAEHKTSDSLYSDALKIYKNILQKYSLDAESYGRIKLNLGYLYYYYLNNVSEAKKCFQELLKRDFSTLNKKNKTINAVSELEPYHKHFAAVRLAEIALEEKKYKTALHYINLFINKYGYESYCGSRNSDYDFYKIQMYSRAFAGLGDTIKALNMLLPEIFKSDNYYLVDLTVGLLKAKYAQSYLLKELGQSISKLSCDSSKYSGQFFNDYYLHYLNRRIEVQVSFIPPYFFWSDSANVDRKREYLKQAGIPEDYENLPEIELMKLGVRTSYFYTKLNE